MEEVVTSHLSRVPSVRGRRRSGWASPLHENGASPSRWRLSTPDATESRDLATAVLGSSHAASALRLRLPPGDRSPRGAGVRGPVGLAVRGLRVRADPSARPAGPHPAAGRRTGGVDAEPFPEPRPPPRALAPHPGHGARMDPLARDDSLPRLVRVVRPRRERGDRQRRRRHHDRARADAPRAPPPPRTRGGAHGLRALRPLLHRARPRPPQARGGRATTPPRPGAASGSTLSSSASSPPARSTRGSSRDAARGTRASRGP